jgi:hypothetical protein
LTVKLAEMIDGVDLSRHSVGDELLLSREQARLLIAEGWAVPAARATRHPTPSARLPEAVAADAAAPDRRGVERLRPIAVRFPQHRMNAQPFRRVEDRLRDELQDAEARIIGPGSTVVTPDTTGEG